MNFNIFLLLFSLYLFILTYAVVRSSCRTGTRYFARPKYLEQKGANVPLDLSPARQAQNHDAQHHDFELVALEDYYLIVILA